MRPSSPRVLWGLLAPAAVLVLAAWQGAGALGRREAALTQEAASIRAELIAGGFEFAASEIERRRSQVLAEALRLHESAEGGRALHVDPLVRDHAGRAFQLIEFERERAAAAQTVREQASAAGVKLDASAFEVLADNSESPLQPRRRWAQLAVARAVAARAVAAKVATYEALPVPAVREIRVAKDSPVLAEEILFSVRVTGASGRVQDFVEQLALGAGEGDLRFFIEHLVLRKDGVTAPDQASATVVLAGLLPPAETVPAP